MKKKLLLFFALMSIVCCLFVITASATEIPDWTEITKVDGMPDKSVFGADGTAGAISADISDYGYASFEFKITGFTESNSNVKIAMGAYAAVCDGESTEYSYMQQGTPNEGEGYCFISFNDIVNNKRHK